MRFGLLGPLTVESAGASVPVASGRQRTLLAALLLQPGQVVSADTLVRHVWGEDPPANARAALQVHILRLRRALDGHGPERIVTRPPGYLLALAPGDEVDLAEFDAAIAVNLRGALVVSQAALPHLVEHGYGRIAHVASIAGKEGNPSMIGYSASKAGLIGLVKAMAKEYASDGITINALAPAVIRTAFLDEQPQQVIDYMTAKIPMGRVGTIEEVAEMINFMISPACSFTTGFCFDASGGRATY